MAWGVAAALWSAVAYGLASALQGIGASRASTSDHGQPFLLRVLHQLPFLCGVLLDVTGFAAVLVALQFLPLFSVQAMSAGSLAVTALAVVVVTRARLSHVEWAAVVAVCVGLAMLGVSAGREAPVASSTVFDVVVLLAAVLVVAAGFALSRVETPAVVLGGLAGLGFGITSIAARVLDDLNVVGILTNYAAYALVVGGIGGFAIYTLALQRGSVTSATAGMVVTETVVPAFVGVAVLGDATRHGYAPEAVAGFVLAVVGAVLLSRFGETDDARTTPATAGAPQPALGRQEPGPAGVRSTSGSP